MKNKVSFGVVVFVAFVLGGLSMYYFNYNNTKNNVFVDSGGEMVCSNCNSGTIIVEDGSLSAAVEKVYSSVILVRNYKSNKLAGIGSGFAYKTDSKYTYIMTNHHVIDGGSNFEIVTIDEKVLKATLLGSDEYLDLAILRIDKDSSIPPVKINTKGEEKIGDQIFTVGSPVGEEYINTVTNGIISNLNRRVEVSVSGSSEDWVMEVLQTNAEVNPGNSGGPLVNAKGEVIGVISMKLVDSSVEGMGFAIPINYAMSHVDTLENGKKIERPLLGISMLNASDTWTLYRYGITLDSKIDSGIVIMDVSKDSAASKAGLNKGDVVVKVDNSEVPNVAYLKYLLYKYNIGDTVKLTYYRDGKFKTCNVTLVKGN